MVMRTRQECTIARQTEVKGIGFLTGADVRLAFRPAKAGSGVRFVRVDLPGSPSVEASIEHVVPRQRRTSIQNGEALVEMVEHVAAAAWAPNRQLRNPDRCLRNSRMRWLFANVHVGAHGSRHRRAEQAQGSDID